jgi:hypothetical protein
MSQTAPSRRAQAASAIARKSTRRHPDDRRRDTERRVRRVTAWLRTFRSPDRNGSSVPR